MITLTKLLISLESDKKKLDHSIKQLIDTPVGLNNQVSNYILSSGGKRIRPLIFLLISKAIGKMTDKHYQFAAAIEFIHTASLLHDDVVDNSKTRRGNRTANHKFGNSASVLVGDFLYTRGYKIIAENPKAAQLIANATNQLTLGEVMQLENINNIALTEVDYFEIIRLKTAILFSAACQLPCLLNADFTHQEAFANYGHYLGIAFQIADDILDYLGDSQKTGKQIGNDLTEKKLTLPIIYALNKAKDKDKDKLKTILSNGDSSQINYVLDLLNSTQAITYASQLAQQYAKKAQLAIKDLPQSKHKKMLLLLPDFAIQRNA